MMSECNYLLQSNKLSYEDLLKYLRRRERAYVSFLEFCIDRSIFSKEVLLDILKHQELNKTLFVDSLRAIAGEEFTDDLVKVYYSQIPSIFRYIEYSDEIETLISESPQQEGEQQENNVLVFSQDGDLNANSSSAMSVLSGYPSGEAEEWIFPSLSGEEPDAALIEDFLHTFDDQKRTEMENTIMSLRRKNDEDLVSAMSLLYRDFHTVKGSARFAKLIVFETLTHDLEELISVSQTIYGSLAKDKKDLVEEALLLGMDVLSQLKITIIDTNSEYPMAEDSVWIQKVNQMLKVLRQAKAAAFEALQGQTEEDLLSKF